MIPTILHQLHTTLTVTVSFTSTDLAADFALPSPISPSILIAPEDEERKARTVIPEPLS